ncbi:MAG: hypothetical protein M0Z70_08015 [Nitrospiraceae bacterium]|nr:hypothetical protein [Nitrospirota bacterium]MDA8339227.1 hypothetical protein [Nitrospiraceae bacterium]
MLSKNTHTGIMTALLLLIFAASPAESQNSALSDEAQKCLSCHSQHGLVKTFENKDSLEAYVDSEKFKASAHGSLKCSDCHADFTGEKHPQRRFRSKEQYKTKSAMTCRRCHRCEQIKTKSIHSRLLTEEDSGMSHPCTNCHGSHSIMPVSRKTYKNEEQYCLKCHGHKLNMGFKSGENLSLKIDLSLLQNSVHKRLSCSDCHFGFSHSQHPQRNFKGMRDLSIANAETCRRCHFDKYTKTMESIHYAMLSQGYLNAPVCTDCHGTHNIISTRSTDPATVKANLVRRCQQCHKDAAKNFPDAWLSHYEPTLANAPLVFIVTMIYKIFTPIMVIGIILQILLHIWRYAVNR